MIVVGAESEDLCDLFVLSPLQSFLVFLLLGGVRVELYPTDFAVVELASDEEDDPIATPFCNSNSVVAHDIAESRVLV